jgi:hypothetical protein
MYVGYNPGSDAFCCELLPGVTSCHDTVRILRCPWRVLGSLSAPYPSFRRLTDLDLSGFDRDPKSPAWDLMADGRLPALATLSIVISHDVICDYSGKLLEPGRLTRAFGGVAGTLRRLTITSDSGAGVVTSSDPFRELGEAIGKLRRLRYLSLSVASSGRPFHGVGQGLAASGGCPELLELYIGGLNEHVDWVTREGGLIVPSVRNLQIGGRCDEEEALLLYCGLARIGYKHRVVHQLIKLEGGEYKPHSVSSLACIRAILQGASFVIVTSPLTRE